MIDAVVHWQNLASTDGGWNRQRCLYAYLAPRDSEILYIGKAWGVTVRGRWQRTAKRNFWNDLERKRGIRMHRVIVGDILLPAEMRLSHELLCDIESLLIWELQPWGNIQSRCSRVSRPGFVVACRGSWPDRDGVFRDAG